MRTRRSWQAGFAAAALALIAAATVYTASAPGGPNITVYESPT